jgi:tetratricopeptide (TPR) repeat protein
MRRHVVPLILIAVVSVALFLNGLRSEFFWDDKPMIVDNVHIRDLRNCARFFTPQYWKMLNAEPKTMRGRAYRPLVEASFAADYAVWGLNPVGWHITSVLWHAANCVLVYFLAYRILGDRWGAALCGLLFAAHPIHVEAVLWPKARSALMSFMFMLASVLLYLRYMEAPRVGRNVWLYVGSVGAFLLSVTSRASAAVVVPPLLVLCLWRLIPRTRLRAGLLAVLPFAGILTAFFAFRHFIPTASEPPWILSPYEHRLTMLSTTGVYLRLLLLPIGLCLDHPHPLPHSLRETDALIGLVLLLMLVGGAVVAFRRSKCAFFALAWLLIGMAPISNVWLFTRPIGELRTYGASVGFCLLPAILVHGLWVSFAPLRSGRALRKMALALCIVVVAAYSWLTIARNTDWRDNLTLWQDTVRKNPASPEAHRNLAQIYLERGDAVAAIPHFRRTAQIHSEYVWALRHLARLCDETGLDDEAISSYERLLQFRPRDVESHIGLGALHARRNRLVEAADQFKAALAYDPGSATAYHNLGGVCLLQGRYAEAAAEFRRALELAPDDAASHHWLGTAYAGMDRHEDALAAYRASLKSDPGQPQTWLEMGECYERIGSAEEAIRAYEQCAALGGPLAEKAKEHLARLVPGRAGAGR